MKPELHTLMDGPGHWRVTTLSGSVHELVAPNLAWRRIPAAGAFQAAHDGHWVRLRRLSRVEVGARVSLEVSDGGYLYGNTWHKTSIVVSIQRLPGYCIECGSRRPLRVPCWRCTVQPDWFEGDDGADPRRVALRRRIERRLGRIRSWRHNAWAAVKKSAYNASDWRWWIDGVRPLTAEDLEPAYCQNCRYLLIGDTYPSLAGCLMCRISPGWAWRTHSFSDSPRRYPDAARLRRRVRWVEFIARLRGVPATQPRS
ncbi:hypothetical protein [Cryobacterium sp. 5B3]|uniref:hypothetical protein n=1 Tax=Cryobacterium sp. 5B3 TaxID=3048586 RepID=UPI002AB3B4CB|nr:hypothetical protein [Cryobacterium sp. 5B3]MDY7540931.1 hypothetical protein [Cryobacterium sp. 5B3]MEB0274838.1 hypothetical protein [Cryobacterium sp. 5B3]